MRLYTELLLLVLVAAVVVFIVLYLNNHIKAGPEKYVGPEEWVAVDYTSGDWTVACVVLRRYKSKHDRNHWEITETREVARTPNKDVSYEENYYAIMLSARQRATTLNALHN